SRRRHTRSYGDWSSDVCSSDLLRLRRKQDPVVFALMVALRVVRVDNATPIILNCEKSVTLGTLVAVHEALTRNGRAVCRCGVDEIGRASCRERGAGLGVAVVAT